MPGESKVSSLFSIWPHLCCTDHGQWRLAAGRLFAWQPFRLEAAMCAKLCQTGKSKAHFWPTEMAHLSGPSRRLGWSLAFPSSGPRESPPFCGAWRVARGATSCRLALMISIISYPPAHSSKGPTGGHSAGWRQANGAESRLLGKTNKAPAATGFTLRRALPTPGTRPGAPTGFRCLDEDERPPGATCVRLFHRINLFAAMCRQHTSCRQ